MFSIENISLIITALINLILFIVISMRISKSKNTFFFLLFNSAVFGWVVTVALFKMLSMDNFLIHYIPQAIYAFAAIIPVSLIFFIETFPNKKLNLNTLKYIFIIIIPVCIFIMSLIPGLIVGGVKESASGLRGIEFGIFYMAYLVYIVFYFIIGLIRMAQDYFIFTGIAKSRVRVIFFSILVSSTAGMVANLILPTFGIFNFFWLGPVFSSYMVITIGYGIVKYGLFETKLIATEFATFLMWGLMFIRIFYSKGLDEKLINGGLFLIIFGVGVYIIRSAMKESYLKDNIAAANLALEQKNLELKRVSDEKTEFVSLASHQIRGPLTSIKGYSSLMLEGDMGTVSEEAKESLRIIIKSCSTLASVVNDYLDVSRIEQGKMRYEFEEVDMRELIKECTTELSSSIKDHNLTCDLDLPTDPASESNWFIVRADHAKLKQVIMNLIDNAIKYTAKGGIKIKLLQKDAHKIRIEVKDTGLGIDPSVMSKLFSKFTRSEDATQANILGTGLGLYIARAIIGAHEGRVWAESEGLGKGSTFIIEMKSI